VDRERIERRDFPTGRRGYDPAAVDEHLRRVADEFEAHLNAPRRSLADSTSEQVRQILEAAERSASEMRSEAAGQLARVEAAAGGMLTRLDRLENELNGLLEALRASGERLTEGLAELRAAVDTSAPSAPPAPADAAPPPAPADAAPPPAPADAAPPPAPADAAPPPAADAAPTDASSPAPAASPPPAADDEPPADPSPPEPSSNGASAPDDTLFDPGPAQADEAGARLIALNMALSGSSREDTARYLAEHFTLDDPDALLDDVYARAGR